MRLKESIFPVSQFEALGLSPSVLKSIAPLGFDAPTPIQQQAIPLVLDGNDLIGLAQTGTGKTAAFGLPLVHHLLANRGRPPKKVIRSLILAPTRELVNQIAENLKLFVRGTPLRVECVVGGAPINRQIRNINRGADILVATPGRLLDLVDRNAVILDKATFLVLDEADQMLDMGFIHSLKKIATLLGSPRQTLLFSATMPRQIENLSRAYLTDPVRIEVAPAGKAADKISQSVHFIEKGDKLALLKKCLSERPGDLSLVFARTKHGAEKLMKQLNAAGFEAVSIHGNKNQSQRERALKAFRSGKARILVATDVAARGIDIPGVSHVYNYELPEVAENYVHRIGRTARAGAEGEGVAFCSPEEIGLLRAVEKLMRLKIDVASGDVPADSRAVRPSRGGRGGRNGSGRARPGKGGRPFGRGRRSEAGKGEDGHRAPKKSSHRGQGRKHSDEGASETREATGVVARKPRRAKPAVKSGGKPLAEKSSGNSFQKSGGKPGEKTGKSSKQKPRSGGKPFKGKPAGDKPANSNFKKRRRPNGKRTAA